MKIKLTVQTNFTYDIEDARVQALVKEIAEDRRLLKEGKITVRDLPPDYYAILEKVPADAQVEELVRTTLGEITCLAMASAGTVVADSGPGIFCVSQRSQYQETPEKLDPPADAVPQVVHKGDRKAA